ncbi:hypothetical protein [Streptomyces xiaopingdaonensis]|uniref:hypothetical protein n=1 Tax=Streptomyces xiaopingdaonensis TaxID=1565415 RepID=UPI000305B0B7
MSTPTTPSGRGAAAGRRVRQGRRSAVQDHVALAEIELCGELMIAASAAEEAGEERLSRERIDEVLNRAPAELDGVLPPRLAGERGPA